MNVGSRRHIARRRQRKPLNARRRFVFESLEDRRPLDANGLWVTAVTPAGASAHPFDKLDIQFSEAVTDGSFTVADVAFTGPSGTITPLALNKLTPESYELDATGLTGLDTYTITIDTGPTDTSGNHLQQYVGDLFAAGVSISPSNTSYDGQNIVVDGNVASIDGTHSFQSLGVFDGAHVIDAAASLTITNSLIVGSGSTLTLDLPSGQTPAAGLTVAGGSTLTLGGGSIANISDMLKVTGSSTIIAQSTNTNGQVNGQWAGKGVTIDAANVTVDAGSQIDADGQGYRGDTGPGAGNEGGTYGGLGGGSTNTAVYGSPTAPTDLGSGGNSGDLLGGGVGGAGGGAVTLNVSGALELDGVISANGQSIADRGNPGSGGSIYVQAGTLAGAGDFSASGGNNLAHRNGGGGGGRIAVYYNQGSSFTGFTSSTAAGGAAGVAGQVGTEAFFDTSVTDNGLHVYQNFILPGGSHLTYGSISVANAGTLTIGGGTTVHVDTALSVTGSSTVIAQASNTTGPVGGQWVGAGVTIDAASVTVDAGSQINADAQGYRADTGPGQSGSGGGTYGGVGGSSSAAPYGSSATPIDLGSGGNSYDPLGGGVGGIGGGALTFNVSGTLQLDGTISANGQSIVDRGSGGAGGSIFVQTSTLSGAGHFSALGGSNQASRDGGGGGGRIAVYYGQASSFAGFAASTAAGGTGGVAGQVGTTGFFDTSIANDALHVYENFVLQPTGPTTLNSITVDNGGSTTTGASLTVEESLTVSQSVAVANGGTLTFAGGTTQNVGGSLSVTGKSTVVAEGANTTAPIGGSWAGVGVTIDAANVTVDANSRISADGQGYVAGTGPGAVNGGGSYGGIGGVNSAVPYGSTTAPIDLGSGGNDYDPLGGGAGGAGGGAIALNVSGTFQLDGVVSANGQDVTERGSGGAGGSVYVQTATLTGAGHFSVLGGSNLAGRDGAGGGGRIAVYYNHESAFAGFASSTAKGGNAGVAGQVGTTGFFDTSITNDGLHVYENFTFAPDSQPHYGALALANGGTVWLGGGANLTIDGAMNVSGNSTLYVESKNNTGPVNGQWVGAGASITAGSIDVAAGSSISADSMGYTQNTGPGATGGAGGGTYGGVGGGSSAALYGDFFSPLDLGSGGKSYDPLGGGTGGAGGGAIRLTSGGLLQLDGTISANGQSIADRGAGGSGGSIEVHTGSLAGGGYFGAKGGGSLAGREGGGGGGRIAVYYTDGSQFTGYKTTTAAGGTGSIAGGKGTILFNALPASTVSPLPQYSPATFTVSWVGDPKNGPGIDTYSVFVSDNGGAFTSLVSNTTATSTSFTGQSGHTYGFYSIATDIVGNPQTTPTAAQATTTVAATAILGVSNSAPASITAGEDVTYTITLTNNGPDDAQDVVLTDALPVGTTFVSETHPIGFAATTPALGSNGTITESISTLPAGATETFTIVALVSASAADQATISDTASVSSSTANTGSSSATAGSTVATRASLNLSKTGPETVTAGGDATYTVVLTNNGPSDAQNVVVTDALPTGTTFVSESHPTGFTASTPAGGANGTITESIATLAAGASETFTVVLQIAPNVSDGAVISNTAAVATSTTGSTEAASSSASSSVQTQANLSLSKTGPETVTEGTNATYTITVTNIGPSDAQKVVVTDSLPAGTTFVSESHPSGFTATTPTVGSNGTLTESIATLQAGASETFTLVVLVSPDLTAGSRLQNTASVSSSTTNIGESSSSTATSTVLPPVSGEQINGTGVAVSGYEFSQLSNVTVARFTVSPITASPANLTTDSPLTAAVAGNQFTATINWGDGTSSTGSVTPTGDSQSYTVTGTHTYTDEGIYPVSVIVSGASSPATITTQAKIHEQLLEEGTVGTPDQNWVQEIYRDLFNRLAEPQGRDYWVAKLEAGETRGQVALEIARTATPEENQRDTVEALYETYLSRPADPAGLNYWIGLLYDGWTAEQIAAQICGSGEYYKKYGGSNASYLAGLYQDALNRPIDPQARAYFEAAMAKGATTAQVAEAIFSSPEYQRDLVTGWYEDLLERPADPNGLAHFASQLVSGERDEYVIAEMLASDEYFAKANI